MTDRYRASHRLGTLAILLSLLPAQPALAQAAPPFNQPLPPLLEPSPGAPTFSARVHPDLESGRLSARWRMGFVAGEGDTRQVPLALAAGMEIHDVLGVGVGGVHSSPLQEGAPFRLHEVLLEGVSPGDRVEFEVVYSGSPHFSSDGMTRLDGEWVELMLDSFWFPLFATFDRTLAGTLQLVLPREWTVVSGGPSGFRGGVHEVEFPEPGPDVHFVAAPGLERLEADGFLLFHRRADPEHLARVLESARACAGYLNGLYGARRPLRELRIVVTDREEVAYHRHNFISLTGTPFPTPRQAEALFCHEMAHHWSRSADFMSPHHWMSEAFAEFAAARFIREHHGREAFDREVEGWERAGGPVGPVWTPELTARPSFQLMYRRAPALLARLEARIGEESFAAFMARYMTEAVARTERLLEILEEVAGEEAADWFRGELAGGPGW